jgi:hypothetical protein
MFSQIILIGGFTIFSAAVEKGLEAAGKENHAKSLGFVTRCGLGLYALKQVNDLVKEVTRDFL